MDNLIDKVIAAVPRKMVLGLISIIIIARFAESFDTVGKLYALGSMTIISVVSISLHFLLEWKNPTKESK